MKDEALLPCPFCGGEPEEDAGGCIEFYGHEHQDYSIACKQCGAEVYCSVGTFEKADVPCSCHYDTRKVCVDKWNRRSTTVDYSPGIPDFEEAFAPDLSMSPEEFIREFRKLASSSTLGTLYYHATGEWIPVTERMPENKPGSYKYLVFETLTNRVNHDYWNVPGTGEEFTPFWNHYGDYVTHWMPLPAGPKEQDNV